MSEEVYGRILISERSMVIGGGGGSPSRLVIADGQPQLSSWSKI